MSEFTTPRQLSPFRRMAAAMWGRPRDPTIYRSMDIDAGPALRFLDDHGRRTGEKLTITHLVVRALALTLRDHPEVNAKVRFWGKLELRRDVNVFVTVATEQGRDLSGVRIDRADQRSLTEIARELKGQVGRIRDGADPTHEKSRGIFRWLPWWLCRLLVRALDLLVNELHLNLKRLGAPRDPFGSAVVTSVGMFGIDTAFAPFLPLARAPILLLIPEIRPRPWVVGDRLEVRPVLRLCASFDHRVLDGFHAGRLARQLGDLLAKPEEMG